MPVGNGGPPDQFYSEYFDLDGRMNDEGKRTGTFEVGVISTAKLADAARSDAEFMQVGEVYRDDKAFDVQALIDELVADESVPLLPVLRYKSAGLRKRVTAIAITLSADLLIRTVEVTQRGGDTTLITFGKVQRNAKLGQGTFR